MIQVTFTGTTHGTAELDREQSLLAAASKAGADLTHRCGGHARCGTCRVTVESGQEHLTPMGTTERRVLETLGVGPDVRLACQAWARGEVCCRVDPLLAK